MFYYQKPKIRDVFLYERQSLEDDDPRQTHSIPLQHKFNLEFAEHMNLRIVETFVDKASAKTPSNRPEFSRMIKELSYKNPKRRRADGILSWHPDRLSRNGKEAGVIVQMICDDLIKDLFFPVFHFQNDPSGISNLMGEFGRAISYSEWLSINSKRGLIGRQEEGAWVYGRSKFGYTKLREVPESTKRCSLFPIPDEKTFPARLRLIELWKAGITDENCCEIIKREFGFSLSRSAISNMRKDHFNYGIYVVKPGEKDERRIDFTKLKAPDGTRFQTVTDEATFWSFQSFKRKEAPNKKKSKHLNPLQGLVNCSYCESRMRPARKNIRRSGQVIEKQLGYECHTKRSDNTSCPQCRVPVKFLYEGISDQMRRLVGVLDEKHYEQYQVGLRKFIAEQTSREKTTRIQYSKQISKLEKEKSSVIDKKLAAIRDYQYDDDTRKWVTRRLKEINHDLDVLKEQNKDNLSGSKSKVMSFKKFIELKDNLHRYWACANEVQKKKIAELLILNLSMDMKGIRSVTWVEPVTQWETPPQVGVGGAYYPNIEPYFQRLWDGLFSAKNKAFVAEAIMLSDELEDFKMAA